MKSLILPFVLLASTLHAQGTGGFNASTGLAVQQNRVARNADLHTMAQMPGHVPAWVQTTTDLGAVAADTSMQLTFVLARSPELQAAFTRLLADQQDLTSPYYHQWLTPDQVGTLYGPTRQDLAALTTWLTGQGFSLTETAPSRMFLTVTAPASTVASAFGTSLHTFGSKGQTRITTIAEPSLPAAFAPLVSTIVGLSQHDSTPMHHMEAVHLTPSETSGADLQPQFNFGTRHYLTPGDFATIFNMNPSYNAGITGTGQKVAIIGRSRIASVDVTSFEALTGIATNLPNVVIPTNGTDPGLVANGDQYEALLDVTRVIGTAPKVQADLVVSRSTTTGDGVGIAANYEVQTLRDPVMTISFGSCETYNGAGGVQFWDTLFSQAASQGISVFVSSADSAAATCESQFGDVPAYQFRNINVICSSSYATCVGGTELAETTNTGLYWGTSNGTTLASALSYIPEGAWNEPINTVGGVTTYVARGGGGGSSLYIPKPSWQTGVGVPADGARDVPDISFPSAGHDGYFTCLQAIIGTCSAGNFEIFSGTSAAAPGMAGVAALLNQKLGHAQGNFNPLIYALAASAPSAFHDATPASSGVSPCDVNTASMCNNSLPGQNGLTGGLVGYPLTVGYDLATGLGTPDVTNFLTAAAALVVTAKAPTVLAVTEALATISNTGTDVFTATLTSTTAGTLTGTVQFYGNSTKLGSPIAVANGRAVSSALPVTAAGDYIISALYSGDAVYSSAISPGIALTVTGLGSTVRVTPSSSSVATAGTITIAASVVPASGTTVPTGVVVFQTSNSATGASPLYTSPLVNGTAISPSIVLGASGSYTLAAYYLGDTVYTQNSGTNSISVGGAYSFTPSATTLNVSAGATSGNTANIAISPATGFAGTVTMACSVVYNGVGASTYAPTCSLAPLTVTIGGTTSASTVLTLSTTVPHAVQGPVSAGLKPMQMPRNGVSMIFAAMLLCLLPIRRRVPWRALGVVLLMAAGLASISGCGGGSTAAAPVGTSKGSYAVIVSGTNSTVAANPAPLVLTLNVN